jgi:hypothetical protein
MSRDTGVLGVFGLHGVATRVYCLWRTTASMLSASVWHRAADRSRGYYGCRGCRPFSFLPPNQILQRATTEKVSMSPKETPPVLQKTVRLIEHVNLPGL